MLIKASLNTAFRIIKSPMSILFILTCIFFYKLFLNFSESIYPAYDVWAQYFFWRKLLVKSVLETGTIPFWNNYQFSGTPFLANPETAVFYPFTWLFFIFPAKSLFGFIFLLDIFLIGLFTYLYTNKILKDKNSAIFSAIIFMFSAPVILRVYAGHLWNLDTLVWFPLLLFLFEKYKSNHKFIYIVFSGLTFGMMILAGHIQYALYISFIFFLYIILRSVSKDFLNSISYLVLSVIIGLLLSSVQTINTLTNSFLSIREGGVDYAFASSYSLHPLQLITFIFPNFFANPMEKPFLGLENYWELAGYVGILPFFFVLFGIFDKKMRSLVLLLIFLSIFSIIFSFGKYSFIYPIFYKFVPFFNMFRLPTTMLFAYTFSISILSGIGFRLLFKSSFIKEKLSYCYVTLGIVASILIGIIFYLNIDINLVEIYRSFIIQNTYVLDKHYIPPINYFISELKYLIATIIILTIILYFFRKNVNRLNYFKLILILFLFIELFKYGNQFIETRKFDVAKSKSKMINYLKEDKTRFRILDLTDKFIIPSSNNFIENITGYDPIYMKHYRDFILKKKQKSVYKYDAFVDISSLESFQKLRLLNLKYFISNDKLYRLSNTLPRAFIISNLDLLSKNEFTYQEANITKYKPNEIAIHVQMKNPGYLILSEVWHPSWKAYDNGKEIKIIKGNDILRTVFLSKGIHSVYFKYDTKPTVISAWVSIGTLIICFYFIFIHYHKSKLYGKKISTS